MCGACTVHVDGRPTRSCITAVGAVAGAKITTIEGLDPNGRHPLQTAWIEMQVPQCGYCQSGQIMQAAVLLKDYPDPTDEDINAVMAGNLCRCMTYVRIRSAIKLAASRIRGGSRAGPSLSRTPCTSGPQGFALSRRNFLIATVETGIVLGYARSALAAVEFPLAAEHATAHGNLFEPTIWYSIDRNGRITVNIIRAEMGQHIGTALARIVADELEADWDKVAIIQVDTDPKWGEMITGGSWSVWQSFPILSRAGAAGRIALIEAGAKLLGVDQNTCTARSGTVVSGSQLIAYGDIVARGNLNRSYTPDELKQMPIKPAAERRLIGGDATALDIPAKVNGEARYGIDAAVDGMIYARPKIPPTRYDCSVVSIDDLQPRACPATSKAWRSTTPLAPRLAGSWSMPKVIRQRAVPQTW